MTFYKRHATLSQNLNKQSFKCASSSFLNKHKKKVEKWKCMDGQVSVSMNMPRIEATLFSHHSVFLIVAINGILGACEW